MPNPDLQIPEPILPEHALIRDAAPVPRLSPGLKSKIMVECGATIAQARRIRRLKVAGAVTAFCALGLLVCLSIPQTPMQPAEVRKQTPVTPKFDSRQHYAIDSPAPPSGPDAESQQVKEIMEELESRKQMMDANLFPNF